MFLSYIYVWLCPLVCAQFNERQIFQDAQVPLWAFFNFAHMPQRTPILASMPTAPGVIQRSLIK